MQRNYVIGASLRAKLTTSVRRRKMIIPKTISRQRAAQSAPRAIPPSPRVGKVVPKGRTPKRTNLPVRVIPRRIVPQGWLATDVVEQTTLPISARSLIPSTHTPMPISPERRHGHSPKRAKHGRLEGRTHALSKTHCLGKSTSQPSVNISGSAKSNERN